MIAYNSGQCPTRGCVERGRDGLYASSYRRCPSAPVVAAVASPSSQPPRARIHRYATSHRRKEVRLQAGSAATSSPEQPAAHLATACAQRVRFIANASCFARSGCGQQRVLAAPTIHRECSQPASKRLQPMQPHNPIQAGSDPLERPTVRIRGASAAGRNAVAGHRRLEASQSSGQPAEQARKRCGLKRRRRRSSPAESDFARERPTVRNTGRKPLRAETPPPLVIPGWKRPIRAANRSNQVRKRCGLNRRRRARPPLRGPPDAQLETGSSQSPRRTIKDGLVHA